MISTWMSTCADGGLAAVVCSKFAQFDDKPFVWVYLCVLVLTSNGFCRKFAKLKFQKILWMWCGSQNRRKKAQSMTLGWKPHNGMWDVDNSCQSEQIIIGLFHLKSASTAPVSWQLRAIALRREDYQRDREAHTCPANGNHPTSSTSNEKRKCILAHQEKL